MSGADQVELFEMPLARYDRGQLLDHMFTALARGQGGWLITANLDFLRRWTQHRETRELYAQADLRVADGMPLVWASRIMGDPLPERVAGSELIWLVAERAAIEGRSVYLLGGAPDAAEEAREQLVGRYPALDVCGCTSPFIGDPPSARELDEIRSALRAAQPDIVLVAFGSPKQERAIQALKDDLPSTWMIGVGISFSFVAGHVRRAPPWIQRLGLEWVHRLAQEPRRLARRYLIDDLPFAARLFARAVVARRTGPADL